jgi:hypothetical protein
LNVFLRSRNSRGWELFSFFSSLVINIFFLIYMCLKRWEWLKDFLKRVSTNVFPALERCTTNETFYAHQHLLKMKYIWHTSDSKCDVVVVHFLPNSIRERRETAGNLYYCCVVHQQLFSIMRPVITTLQQVSFVIECYNIISLLVR